MAEGTFLCNFTHPKAEDTNILLKSMANLPLPSPGPDYHLQRLKDLLKLWIPISAVPLVSAWRAKPPLLSLKQTHCIKGMNFPFPFHLGAGSRLSGWLQPGQQSCTCLPCVWALHWSCSRWPPEKCVPASISANESQKL